METPLLFPITTGSAIITKDRMHRYMLFREWDDRLTRIMFIGLNPSRADDKYNDPTIRRCITHAQQKGHGSMYFANLYSFRTPYVKTKLYLQEGEQFEPLLDNMHHAVGPDCNMWLREMISESDQVVCCWGNFDFARERGMEVLAMIEKPYCFGTNFNKTPKHPLYLKKATTIVPYENAIESMKNSNQGPQRARNGVKPKIKITSNETL